MLFSYPAQSYMSAAPFNACRSLRCQVCSAIKLSKQVSISRNKPRVDCRWTRSSQEKSIASPELTVLSYFVHKTFPQAGVERLERPQCATVMHFEDLFGRRDLPGANPGIGHSAAGPWHSDPSWLWFLPMLGLEAWATSNI